MNEIDEIIVTGGRPLHGSRPGSRGQKMRHFRLWTAALLSTGTSVLRGCPRISDVYLMEKILKYLGARNLVGRSRSLSGLQPCGRHHDTGVLFRKNAFFRDLNGSNAGAEQKGTDRISRRLCDREAAGGSSYPGFAPPWCSCGGKRRNDPGILWKTPRRRDVFFKKRSVGATEQGILAAVLAEGKTVLNGCACEPEIYWLCHYLTGMGGKDPDP